MYCNNMVEIANIFYDQNMRVTNLILITLDGAPPWLLLLVTSCCNIIALKQDKEFDTLLGNSTSPMCIICYDVWNDDIIRR